MNDEPKEVHLNAFAQQVLASLPQGEPEDRLFPEATPEAVSVAFHRVCKELGIVDIRLHDLRHTFATWLRQRGTELDVIASQLGHRDLRMTKRLLLLSPLQSHAWDARRDYHSGPAGNDADSPLQTGPLFGRCSERYFSSCRP